MCVTVSCAFFVKFLTCAPRWICIRNFAFGWEFYLRHGSELRVTPASSKFNFPFQSSLHSWPTMPKMQTSVNENLRQFHSTQEVASKIQQSSCESISSSGKWQSVRAANHIQGANAGHPSGQEGRPFGDIKFYEAHDELIELFHSRPGCSLWLPRRRIWIHPQLRLHARELLNYLQSDSLANIPGSARAGWDIFCTHVSAPHLRISVTL